MAALHQLIAIETRTEREIHDLTPRLREVVAASGIRQGSVLVSSRHTTCAITINENEPRLLEDLKRALARLVPKGAGYLHDDIEARGLPDEPPNADAHLAAMLLGASQTVPVADGTLALGTWQSVLFVELDGPRRRTVSVLIAGER